MKIKFFLALSFFLFLFLFLSQTRPAYAQCLTNFQCLPANDPSCNENTTTPNAKGCVFIEEQGRCGCLRPVTRCQFNIQCQIFPETSGCAVDPSTGRSYCGDPVLRVGGGTILESCGDQGQGVNTAIGCVPITDQNALIGFILRWAIGIGGGIAFILILVAGFQIMTSTGDPKKLQAGQELLTSAIGGLLLLIFSVFILRIIGVDILKLPGLGTPTTQGETGH